MMERFPERVGSSQCKNNFIIKGGILVTAMIGGSQCPVKSIAQDVVISTVFKIA